MPDRINRREAIRHIAAAGGGAALASLTLGHRAEAAPAKRPNIVFILIDDLRWDALSCMDHPFLETPNIDRIANEGVRFENAFVTISLCSPARGCFLTGTHAHVHNVRTNEANDYDPSLSTWPQVLQQRGYETGYVGKWHMAPQSDPRPGFDYWLSFRGQGVHVDPELNENGRVFTQEGYMTDILTKYATDFIEQDRNQPFCLYFAHKAIHGPFIPAERHKDAFADVMIDEPASFQDTFADKPEWIREGIVRGARKEAMLENADKPVPDAMPPGQWQPRNEGRLNYYRMMLSIDESVGQVIDALEQKGILDDTVLVFTSDNGYFQGEHRRGDKRLMYEESIRIPLLVRYPRGAETGLTPEQMVLDIDIAPTMLALAGVNAPQVMQGESFARIIAGETPDWRESWLYEYFKEGWLPGIPTMFGVRTERWKYITFPDIEDIDELYDIQADPTEMKNLALDPAHASVLAEMKTELARLLRETRYAPAPGPTPVTAPVKLLAHYALDEGQGATTASSTPGPDGAINGATWTQGIAGSALAFDGKQSVAIPRNEAVDPTGKPWTVEAWIKPEEADGVVVAMGGQTHGCALYLSEGQPCFAARLAGTLYMAESRNTVGEEWTHLVGVIAGTGEIQLYVNGELAASEQGEGVIRANPNEGIEIGTDIATKVGPYGQECGFTGVIDEVKLYQGALKPAAVRNAYKRRPI